MHDLAAESWGQLAAGPGLGYGQPDERALMDRHLIELARRHSNVHLTKFDQVEETETGADFEWWLDDGSQALGMRVQAKKLDLSRGAYRQLRHGGSASAQVDQLIEAARPSGFLPLYLFFNGPTEGRGADRCPRPESEADRGCTMARADEVKLILEADAPSQEKVAAVSWPWRCLLCCPRFSGRGASECVMRLFEQNSPMADVALWSEPPSYVRGMLSEGSRSGGDFDSAAPEPLAAPTARTVLAMRL